jgi:uncharacterized iron-regulated membrane protein
MTSWQQWLHHPERSPLRNVIFQVHLWVGAIASTYVLVMSISGSIIVYRNVLSRRFSIEWLVKLHSNLLSGSTGKIVNGIGGIGLTLLCLTGAVIWWPGIEHWRRSMTVELACTLCSDQLGPAPRDRVLDVVVLCWFGVCLGFISRFPL